MESVKSFDTIIFYILLVICVLLGVIICFISYRTLMPILGGNNGFTSFILFYSWLFSLLLYSILFFVVKKKYSKLFTLVRKFTIFLGLVILTLVVYFFIKFPPYIENIVYKNTQYDLYFMPSYEDFIMNFCFSILFIFLGFKFKK